MAKRKEYLNEGDLTESRRGARIVRESGMYDTLPAVSPHRYVTGERSDVCTCGLPITDALHQMELFQA